MTRTATLPARRPATDVTDAEDSVVNERLVAEAVAWITAKLQATVYKGAVEIGDYVLEKFFHGDPDRVRSRSAYKNASFRSLAEQCETVELPLSRTSLHRAVGLAMMRRLIAGTDNAFEQLPHSHQAVLLPLNDPVKVEKLAQRAKARQLSVRQLRDVVTKELAKTDDHEQPARRGKPVVVKTLEGSLKLFTTESGRHSFTKGDVEQLSAEQARSALKAAEDLAGRVGNLIEKLRARQG